MSSPLFIKTRKSDPCSTAAFAARRTRRWMDDWVGWMMANTCVCRSSQGTHARMQSEIPRRPSIMNNLVITMDNAVMHPPVLLVMYYNHCHPFHSTELSRQLQHNGTAPFCSSCNRVDAPPPQRYYLRGCFSPYRHFHNKTCGWPAAMADFMACGIATPNPLGAASS